ncbi:hypothetical protein [Dietzia cercidiphylli]|nr:hypothetical protein [Dietzia cercidiphylli]MBB1046481.1 hypothetical protein [Dietzia cercidiphylli]
MSAPLSEPTRDAAIQAKVDREFAGHDLRHAHNELDRLLVEMRRDAEFLDERGNYAGASLMRHKANCITEALGRVRDAEAILNHTPVVQQ